MARFYGEPQTRAAYQCMIDAQASAQPDTEEALVRATLQGDPKNVLELGCGSGRLYARLRAQGMTARYTGVEMATEVIENNRQRFPEARWHVGAGDSLPVPPQSQDCVFAYYVLEHCVFPKQVLDSLLTSLQPGGRLLLTFPDMVVSGIFGSQALGWDDQTAKAHLRNGKILDALVRGWDSRVRLPIALRRVHRTVGAFPVNLKPRCLEPGVKIEPDVDAIYLASRSEVVAWAERQGCSVAYPAGDHGLLRNNVLIEITKPVNIDTPFQGLEAISAER
jgi:SAM-dependent methyltransferase